MRKTFDLLRIDNLNAILIKSPIIIINSFIILIIFSTTKNITRNRNE